MATGRAIVKLFEEDSVSLHPEYLAAIDPSGSPRSRVENIRWKQVESNLSTSPYELLPRLLTADECSALSDLYADEGRFRSRIVMERYAFGRGEYKYFRYPLPDIVQELRSVLYEHLAPIANRWHQAMRMAERFPATHKEFIEICQMAGQNRPTPLMLTYKAEDYCCLHQDLYGDHVFPFQVVFLLSEPTNDFTGGELLLTQTSPARPSTVDVVPLAAGQAVVFPVNSRPVPTIRGHHRVAVRHGVSKLHSGSRKTLGIIFHDAR